MNLKILIQVDLALLNSVPNNWSTDTKLVLTWPKPTSTNCGKTTLQLNSVLHTNNTSKRNQAFILLQATWQNLQTLES